MTEKIHILYADDDDMMRRIIGGELSKHGFEVIYASDGNEAREMARRLKPEFVMLDYRMPIFDGFKVATYLKREEPTKNIPVILLTNEDVSIEAQKMWKEIGLDGYIHKSADFKELYELIAKVFKAYGRSIPPLQKPGDPPAGLSADKAGEAGKKS